MRKSGGVNPDQAATVATMPPSDDTTVLYAYPFWGDLIGSEHDYSMDIIGTHLAASIAARGLKPTIILRRESKGPTQTETDSVEYRIVPWRFRARNVRSTLLKRILSALSLVAYGLSVGWHARRLGARIVHVYIFDELIPLIRALAPSSVRLVLHMHDHRQTLGARSSTERRLSKADLIVGCSEFITESARRAFPELHASFTTVLNATDTEHFSPVPQSSSERSSSEVRIVYIGRLSPEKGVHTLLEAFESVSKTHPEARLVLIGPSNLASFKTVATPASAARLDAIRDMWKGDAYQAMIHARLASASRPSIELHGPMPNDQVSEVLRSADVFVFPSVWEEPFGLPVLEAMASGIPVVASDVGGIKESIEDRTTGFLVPPGDPGQLAACLARLVETPALRAQMGAAGRERVLERFAWDRYVEEWSEIYSQLD